MPWNGNIRAEGLKNVESSPIYKGMSGGGPHLETDNRGDYASFSLGHESCAISILKCRGKKCRRQTRTTVRGILISHCPRDKHHTSTVASLHAQYVHSHRDAGTFLRDILSVSKLV